MDIFFYNNRVEYYCVNNVQTPWEIKPFSTMNQFKYCCKTIKICFIVNKYVSSASICWEQ